VSSPPFFEVYALLHSFGGYIAHARTHAQSPFGLLCCQKKERARETEIKEGSSTTDPHAAGNKATTPRVAKIASFRTEPTADTPTITTSSSAAAAATAATKHIPRDHRPAAHERRGVGGGWQTKQAVTFSDCSCGGLVRKVQSIRQLAGNEGGNKPIRRCLLSYRPPLPVTDFMKEKTFLAKKRACVAVRRRRHLLLPVPDTCYYD
jgi:hypothetical protein